MNALRLIFGLVALIALCACGTNLFKSDRGPRVYQMHSPRTSEGVACIWKKSKREAPVPYADDPALPRTCIALCMRAGFHGDDKELERVVGYQDPIPDRLTQVGMNIPVVCQQ